MTSPDRFVAYLDSLRDRDDRAALAALRRGLGKPPGSAAELFPLVVPYLPPTAGHAEASRYFVVAALFGLHPEPWERPDAKPWERNLGASMARLARLVGEDAEGPRRRFVALLSSDEADLPERLRGTVALLRSHDVPIHWLQLLTDLGRWSRPERSVQLAWARAFWGDREAPGADEAALADAGVEASGEAAMV